MSLIYTTGKYGKFFYYEPDAIGQRIALGEFHDEHLKPYLDALKPEDVFVDVGANIGFLSIYAAKRGARVEAFEANEDIYELMKQNVFENNLLDKINIRNVALYDSETKLVVNPAWLDYAIKPTGGIDWENSPNSGGMSLVAYAGSYVSRTSYYFSRTLDSFCLERINLLKVDTQGCDLRVLSGASATIAEYRPVILFEYEDGGAGVNANGDSFLDFMQFFFSRGYVMEKLCDTMYGSDYVAVPR